MVKIIERILQEKRNFESLEELEDVKAVHGNYDMEVSLLEAISGSPIFFGRMELSSTECLNLKTII